MTALEKKKLEDNHTYESLVFIGNVAKNGW